MVQPAWAKLPKARLSFRHWLAYSANLIWYIVKRVIHL